jgi:hypothetical protein
MKKVRNKRNKSEDLGERKYKRERITKKVSQNSAKGVKGKMQCMENDMKKEKNGCKKSRQGQDERYNAYKRYTGTESEKDFCEMWEMFVDEVIKLQKGQLSVFRIKKSPDVIPC